MDRKAQLKPGWGGGRPPKPEAERRSHRIGVSVNQAEREAIEAKAAKVGMAPSVYLRRAGVGARLGVARSNVIYHRLSRIGFKVKELAGEAKQAGRTVEKERFDVIIGDIKKLLSEL